MGVDMIPERGDAGDCGKGREEGWASILEGVPAGSAGGRVQCRERARGRRRGPDGAVTVVGSQIKEGKLSWAIFEHSGGALEAL